MPRFQCMVIQWRMKLNTLVNFHLGAQIRGRWRCQYWLSTGSSQNVKTKAKYCAKRPTSGLLSAIVTFYLTYPLTVRVVRAQHDFITSFLHFFPCSPTSLWDLPNSRPVHSLMLSSHFFLCLPRLLPPLTVPCKMVLARPDERETWPHHCSLHLFNVVRRIFVSSDCLLDLGTDFLIGNMVFVWNV